MSAPIRLTRPAVELLNEYGVDVNGLRVVAGCSGGVDSTVLLRLLVDMGALPVVAHVNYRLRGEESDADEEAVRNLASDFGLPLHVHVIKEPEKLRHRGASLQETCRDIRYEFYADVARAERASHVALGHTLDDQAETVLLHLSRGSGIEGSSGMAGARPDRRGFTVIRPLLATPRSDIVAVAKEVGMSWREDATNESDAYARGRIRTVVAPAIADALGVNAWQNIGKSANRLRRYLDAGHLPSVDEYIDLVSLDRHAVHIPTLSALEPVVRRRILLELLKRWYPDVPRNASVAEGLDGLLSRETGKSFAHGMVRVVRDRDVLLFEAAPSSDDPGEAEIVPGIAVPFDGAAFLRLDACSLPTSISPGIRAAGHPERHPAGDAPINSGSPHCVFVDPDRIGPNLVVRRWRPGDRFVPLGMTGSKLVSDLLTDRKTATATRKSVPVVVSDDEIVWVVGVEVAEAFRVRSESRHVTALIRLP